MKKTLLAAALAVGFAGVAQAETSVTLYGILDGGIGYKEVKSGGNKAKTTGIFDGVQSGNRWGLKGVEDLGGGLKAVFVLESGFSLKTGDSLQNRGSTNRQFGRRATLGLASDSWGTLEIGRQTNLSSAYMGSIDPFGAGFDQAAIGSSFRSTGTVRVDNLVLYQTPRFSGFQFGVGYSFNVNGNQEAKLSGQDESNNRAITAGLRYNSGPLAVALTYDQVKTGVSDGSWTLNPSTGAIALTGVRASGTTGTAKAWNLGATYDFEVVKVHAAFGQERDGVITGAGTGYRSGHDFNNYLVGLSAPLGGGSLVAGWQLSDARKDAKAAGLKKQQVYSVGYTYGLSKRTNAYAAASYAKNLANADGVKSTLFAVGLRHQF